jgi:glutamate N-acetyltransferase/amino-acid N-acetyltransferase
MNLLDFKVNGFLFSGISAGIKKDGKRDLGLIYSQVPAQVAGVFTQNAVKAAPVRIGIERIKKGLAQAVVINSGNANSCTGNQGLKDGRRISSLVGKALGIEESLVFPSSTGVIGMPLPMVKIERAIPRLVEALSPGRWMDTVESIMTTDTFPKVGIATCRVKGKEVKICGMAKGAGMICPHVATMLSFLVTDVHIKAPLLQRLLREVAEDSYNRITIDGETSTNDTVLLLANGKSGHPPITKVDRDAMIFQRKLLEVCQHLAKSVVRDGEGATKFIEIRIMKAQTAEDAKRAAYAIAHSPLVKTAFFGEDANWGRILSALGHSGVKMNPDRVDLFFGRFPVVRNGIGIGGRSEEKAARVLKNKSIEITIDLHQGKSNWSIFTTDLSIDYVKINGSYRS